MMQIHYRRSDYDQSQRDPKAQKSGTGYDGGITIIKDYVQDKRPPRNTPAVKRYETLPGKQAQMDWVLMLSTFVFRLLCCLAANCRISCRQLLFAACRYNCVGIRGQTYTIDKKNTTGSDLQNLRNE